MRDATQAQREAIRRAQAVSAVMARSGASPAAMRLAAEAASGCQIGYQPHQGRREVERRRRRLKHG